ncbi:MAG: hypothetical protein F8N37_08385 [Telmatospirillum sp.]|nr:hypothetical protein [Telmatospirillum sp.]
MDLATTLSIFVAAVALFGVCWALERRPRSLGRVRLFPYIPVMMICLVVILGMAAHLISLLTGQPVGRQM